MKFIINKTTECSETITRPLTQRCRKAYAKHEGTLDLWYSIGYNHRENQDGWILREVDWPVEVIDFTLESLCQYLKDNSPSIIMFNDEYGLLEIHEGSGDDDMYELLELQEQL